MLLVQFYDGVDRHEFTLQVDDAGKITMPLVGGVNVGGMTPREAADEISWLYAAYYVDPQVAVQVMDYGLIDVFVFGPDFAGKMHKLPNGTQLLDALEEVEIADSGRYRRIHVVRGGFSLNALSEGDDASGHSSSGATLSLTTPSAVARVEGTLTERQNWRAWIDERFSDTESQVWVIDPLSITLEGNLAQNNLVLQDGDAIYIPTPEKIATITGVTREGDYELLAEETLGDLLRISGTVDYARDLQNTVIQRYDASGTLTRLIINLYPALEDVSLSDDFLLCNRDIVKIYPRESRIFVLGEVKVAGAIPFRDDATVLDYLAEAGGETADAHLAWIAIIRQSRDRIHPTSPAEVIRVNFKDLHAGREMKYDTSLLPGDVIYVPPKGASFKPSEIISATGAIITGFAVIDNAQSSN